MVRREPFSGVQPQSLGVSEKGAEDRRGRNSFLPIDLGQSVCKGDDSDQPMCAKENLMDFDELLPYIGEFGTYQKCLFLLMIPFAFFVAWVYFSQIFMGLTPENHWCHIPEFQRTNLTLEQR